MARPKKDNKPVSFRISTDLYERLQEYTEETGMAKTSAFEKALEMYLDDYDRKKQILEEHA